MNNRLLKNSLYTFTLVIVVFISSCARTVTEKDVLLNIELKVQFRSAIDLSKYNYGIAFGTEPPKHPFLPPMHFFQHLDSIMTKKTKN